MATTVSAGSVAGVAHRQRQHGQQLVPVDDLARGVHGQAAVGVPVEREPDVGAVLDDRPLQQPEVGGAAAVVDVQAVGLGADRDDVGTRLAQRQRPDLGRGAVRAVEHHPDPAERAVDGGQTRCSA